MLHTKFRGNRSADSGEEDFKGFYHIWAYVHDLGPRSRNDLDL